MSEPQRTCVGCRIVRPKRMLVRLAWSREGDVVIDARQRGGGRGAYVCPAAACLGRALERGRLAHAFKRPCRVRESLAEEVRDLWQPPR